MSIQKHILADPRNKVEEKVESVNGPSWVQLEARLAEIKKEADMKIKKLLQEKPKKKRSLWARLTKRS